MARVLIVEDDPVSLKLMRDVLQAHGFETRELTDGAEALEEAVAFGADLVVMDVGLPFVDGLDATRQLKADVRTASVPVLAVTAFAMPDDEQRTREAGCDAFLAKPLRFHAFLALVERLTSQKAREAKTPDS